MAMIGWVTSLPRNVSITAQILVNYLLWGQLNREVENSVELCSGITCIDDTNVRTLRELLYTDSRS